MRDREMTDPEREENTPTTKGRGGYLSSRIVKAFSFWTITVCILISVMMSIMAIWDYAGTDVLWRTVATCAVVGMGTGVFAFVNKAFGNDS